MTEHYCQYLQHSSSGVFHAAGESYSGTQQPCGKVAHFRCGNDWWFCAEHYDVFVLFWGSTEGE